MRREQGALVHRRQGRQARRDVPRARRSDRRDRTNDNTKGMHPQTTRLIEDQILPELACNK
jgi:hypothetical protein